MKTKIAKISGVSFSFILVLSIVAIAFLLGSETGFVSGEEEPYIVKTEKYLKGDDEYSVVYYSDNSAEIIKNGNQIDEISDYKNFFPPGSPNKVEFSDYVRTRTESATLQGSLSGTEATSERISESVGGPHTLAEPTCLTPQTQIFVPYLSNGEYLSDEKLEELNRELGGGANGK